MRKKAQGLSLNVIIIAAIALLVLVILAVIFMGRLGVFRKGSGDCETLGGFAQGLVVKVIIQEKCLMIVI